jgi:hypothetical protein
MLMYRFLLAGFVAGMLDKIVFTPVMSTGSDARTDDVLIPPPIPWSFWSSNGTYPPLIISVPPKVHFRRGTIGPLPVIA